MIHVHAAVARNIRSAVAKTSNIVLFDEKIVIFKIYKGVYSKGA